MTYEIQNEIESLVSGGHWDDAVEKLASFSEKTQDPSAMIHLRNLRIDAFEHIIAWKRQSGEKRAVLERSDPFPDAKNTIPEIDASELTLDIFSGAFKYHGALIIRNLLDKLLVEEMVDGIDRTFSAINYSRHFKPNQKNPNPWFSWPENEPEACNRDSLFMMTETGSAWTLISPAMTHKLISLFNDLELKTLLEEYFGSEPCLSFNKWVLRKVKPLTHRAEWHQDGAFMGKGIKSVNLWMALTECGAGTNSPGMDLVPKRLTRVVDTGVDGAIFDWSVSEETVLKKFKGTPPVRPHFNAGDAIFFDHFNLHATSYSRDFTDVRYAIETWFFALDSYADNQSPIIW